MKQEVLEKEKNANDIERALKSTVKTINEDLANKDTRKKKSAQKIKIRCQLTEFNTYLFHEGKNYYSYGFMGAHVVVEKKKKGVRFTTWAPRAKNVFVVGDFSNFEIKNEYKMDKVTEAGLWSIFIPNIKAGQKYKFAIEDAKGNCVYKADPYAFESELRPRTASVITEKSKYKWNDRSWMARKRWFNMHESPINIYEMHLGSWKTKNGEYLTYKELANELPKYIMEMGYTHVEIMPIMEYPLDMSWGYQITGYYSVTSRYGTQDDFRYLIDELHKAGIGVILDWVPGHFCRDLHGLYKFDGTATYEYQEEWRADNKDWGTSNFDLGRPEVKSFLISNAIYWIKEFHLDGLRIDAVSNILYLDYGKQHGEWKPNIYGDNGSLEGIQFIKELNRAVKNETVNTMMIAEESTAWPKISKPIEEGGLGFDFKWNMGWMHDTLDYIQEDPLNRKYHHGKMTFSMMYNYSENFILPISHDEVVHGKKIFGG